MLSALPPNLINKIQQHRFDKEYLNELLQKDKAILLEDYKTFNRDMKPRFRCSCNKEENKRTFRYISTKGAYCHDCIYTKGSEQRNKTVKKIYGAECVSQIESVKLKRVATNMERRGVAVPFQATEIKKKSKATCLEKYGVEHPLQNTIIMGNLMATNLERYGTTCSLQTDSAKEKTLITLQKNYGENITNAFQADEVKKKSRKTNIKRFGVEYPSQAGEVKDKIKATNLERYNVEYPSQTEEIKDKIKATNLERHGVEYTFQSADVKDKIKVTNLDRYGVENPLQNKEIMDKVKATNMERYGVENPLQNKEIMEKTKATNLERYGFEHVLQNPEIMKRQQDKSFKIKHFVMPSGEVRKVQGFEPFALKILVKKYSEEQIKTDRTNVPRILYKDNGKDRYHYPDIWIPHENRLIEVKSTQTYEWHKEEVLLKKKACEEQGYNYEIWCFDGKGNRVEV